MASFWRVIEIVVHGSTADGLVKVALEDDYHHFRVGLQLHNHSITETYAEALRTPYTLCAKAGAQLKKLEQRPVPDTAVAIYRYCDARLQCTHQLDMAGLGLAAIARGDTRRHYQIEVPRHCSGQTQPRLWRDGALLLEWHVLDNIIRGPAPYDDVTLSKGLSRWAMENFDQDLAEAIIVLRRGTIIAQGRLRNLDLEVHARPHGHCYAQQPERATQALRVKGSTLDFTHCNSKLCTTDQQWLHQGLSLKSAPAI